MTEPAARYRRPAQALRPFITTYYWVDIPEGIGEQRDWLHPEWPNIRFLLDGGWTVAPTGAWEEAPLACVFGPTCRTVPVVGTSPARLLGVGLLPIGYATLFDLDAAAVAHRVISLEEHAPAIENLRRALADDADDDAQAARLDAYFSDWIARRPAAPDVLRRAHAALLDPETTTVEEFAETMGLSSRHLLRLCRRLFGFPPKLLLRRQRFMRTLEAAFAERDRPFADLLDASYFDQSHFVRDFRLFMGFAPSQYFHLDRPLQGIAQRERLKALGVSFQGLQEQQMKQDSESVSSKPPRVSAA